MRIAFLVTHLLGTGHLSRVLTLARAFAVENHDVHVLSGGVKVPNLVTHGVTLHQIPPLKSDGVNFTSLLDENGNPVDQSHLNTRKEFIKNTISDLTPDVLVTELYPFGRRVLNAEFLTALNTTRSLPKTPLVLCSIRDILAPPSKPQKAVEAGAVLAAFYDGVLVHSDAKKTPLSASWPVSDAVREMLYYTGYVAPPAPSKHPDMAGKSEVLVTAGGGSVGQPLFHAALKAAALDKKRVWRLLVGGADKAKQMAKLQNAATTQNVIIESARPDFRQMLNHADACLCMCGYNTAIDLLQTGTPAVFVPFDDGGEVEQTLRAQSLATLPEYEMVKSADATPERLFEALSALPNRSNPAPLEGFQGSQKTVQIVQDLLEKKHG